MTIDQATPRAAIDWQSFDIGSAAHVDIRQPSSQSVLLNQVLGGSPSQIFGNLTANGQVFLTNPNGIYFAPGATVDVGGLVATTHRLSVEDFLAGRDHFTRNGATGTIVNEGQLRASLQGYIALLAPEVRNRGVIIAELGTVALAAGETFTLHFDQQRHLTDLRVEQTALRTLVENGQAVLAPGGYIILSSLGLQQVEGSVIRHTGTLDASSLVSRGGRIVLEGDAIALGPRSTTAATGATGGGTVLVGGDWQGSGTTHQATSVTMAEGASIDASATVKGDGGKVVLWSDVHNTKSRTQFDGHISAHGGTQGGDGGQVETSGHTLRMAGARVDTRAPAGKTGLWLLDPGNIHITDGAGWEVGEGQITWPTFEPPAVGTGYNADGWTLIHPNAVTYALGFSNLSITTGTGSAYELRVSSPLSFSANSNALTLTASGDLNIYSAISLAGPISLYGRNIHFTADLTSTASGAAIQAIASNNITSSSGVDLTTQRGNILLSANSDRSGGGAIAVSGITASSNGGHITLGGGTDGSGYAEGTSDVAIGVHYRGIWAQNSTFNAGGGDITLRGKGWQGPAWASPTNADYAIGIDLVTNSLLQTNSTGNITLDGVGGLNYRGDTHGVGINFYDAPRIVAEAGAINIDGTAGTGSARLHAGIQYDGGGAMSIRSTSGAITLTGRGLRTDIGIQQGGSNAMSLGWDGASGSPTSGAITLNADALAFSGPLSVKTSGALTVQPIGNSFLAPLNWPPANLSIGSTLGGLTLGKPANTADITVASAQTVAGPISIYGGNIAINAALTATGSNTVTLAGTGTVTDGVSGSIVADNLALLGGDVTLDSTSNNVATLAANGVGSLTYVDSNALSLGTVGGTNGVSASGAVSIATLTGDLTVSQNIATTSATTSALILNAGKNASAGTASGGNLLISGSPSITVGAGGRATLYSGSIASSTGLTGLVGSGSGRFRYYSDETASNFTQALGSGTYGVYRDQPTVAVTVDNQTITYGSVLPTWTYTLGSAVNGDNVSQIFASPSVTIGGPTSTGGHATVGTHTLTSTGTSSSQLGYAVGTVNNGTLTVNAKSITTPLVVNNKAYDGTTGATFSASANGAITGDLVAIGGTATFDTKQVGTGKPVSITGLTLTGADAGNYTLPSATDSTTADITAKGVTVSGLTAANKVYDGTTAATVNHGGAVFTGQISGDVLTAAGSTGTFANKNVGTGKTVTLSGTTYGGADAGNYTFTDQAATTADITAKPLTLDLQGQGSKVYDGSTSITLTGITPTVSGVVSGDTVTATTGSVTGFADKHAGTNKAVLFSGFGLGGADATNYLLVSGNAPSTATIMPKAVVVSGLTAANKVYDGTTATTVNHSGTVFTGLVAGDSVTASGTVGTFADPAAGAGKLVALSSTVYGGADAGNYTFTGQTHTTADILVATGGTAGQSSIGEVINGVIQLGQGIRLPVGSPSTMPGTPSQALPNYSASALIAGPQGHTFTSLNSATASSRTQSAGLVVDLVQQVSAARNGIVTVFIPTELMQRHESLVFSLPAELVTALGDKPDQFTQMGGEALPYWLGYDPKEGTFHIPDTTFSSLPISLVTVLRGQEVVVTIVQKED